MSMDGRGPRPRTGRPVSLHQPVRPSWRCGACHDEWPCARRKDELVRETEAQVVQLSLLMSGYFTEAMEDSPSTPPHQLWLRFVAWVRPHVHAWREQAFIAVWGETRPRFGVDQG